MNADLRKQASLGIEPFVDFVAGGIADQLDRDKITRLTFGDYFRNL
jgi:hypothetical protein